MHRSEIICREVNDSARFSGFKPPRRVPRPPRKMKFFQAGSRVLNFYCAALRFFYDCEFRYFERRQRPAERSTDWSKMYTASRLYRACARVRACEPSNNSRGTRAEEQLPESCAERFLRCLPERHGGRAGRKGTGCLR